MIPFSHTWPYEIVQNDTYVQECPFCSAGNVLLPLKKKQFDAINSGSKKLLVFPCCYSNVTIVGTDSDYLLADRPLRKFPR